MANLNKYSIIFSQRDSAGSTFTEQYVSGSRLIIQTDAAGNIVGSGSIDATPIGQNIAAAGTFTNLTATGLTSLVNVSASAASLNGNLTLSGLNPTISNTNGNLTISSTNGNYVYVNNVAFSGSGVTIPGNLTVQGNITYISSSVVDVGTNRIRVNVNTPAQRYGGFDVIDSGSANYTASLLWDSKNDYWLISDALNPQITNMVLGGPTGSFGSEVGLTIGYIPRVQSADTLENSLLVENGTQLNYNSGKFIVASATGNTTIGGTLNATGGLTTLSNVSASNINATGLISALSGSFSNLNIANSSFTNLTVTNIATIATLSGSNGNFTGTITAATGSINNFSIGGTAPTLTGDPGLNGSIRFDANFAYIYTSGQWKRTPLAAF